MNGAISGVVEIHQSPWKMIGMAVMGILGTAMCAVVAFHLLPNTHLTPLQELAVDAGTLLAPLATVAAVWRLLTVRGAVITIMPEGIRDTRVAAELIPWSAITGISTWQYNRQKTLVLAVDPAAENKLTLTRIARWTRAPNRALGADGLCIVATGLNISYDKLLRTCMAHVQYPRSAAQ